MFYSTSGDRLVAKMSNPSKFLEPLAMAVASGNSIKAACEIVVCSIQTGYNLSCTDVFKARVSAIRSEITEQSVGKLTDASVLAVSTIISLLGPANEPSVRLNAAKAILANLGPLSELGELRARIDRIEAGQLKVHRA